MKVTRRLRDLCRTLYQRVMRIAHWLRFRRRYFGFRLPYFASPAFDRMPRASYCEPEVTQAILAELQTRLSVRGGAAPVIVDVGANLGFVTMNVLHRYPNARVYAFEPGPFQRRILRSIIERNRLSGQVTVIPDALGAEPGRADFFTHPEPDACGLDGLRDTGVIGPGQRIEVGVQTLDQWWTATGEPAVDLMKVDTEGAELLVLRGGERFLGRCRPAMVLEVWPDHLRHYAYTPEDLIEWLEQRHYCLYTLDGTLVERGHAEGIFGHQINFLARPVNWVLEATATQHEASKEG